MDTFTHRQFAVVASRSQDFLHVAEQERLAANAVSTRRRARASSAGVSRVSLLGFMQSLFARLRLFSGARAPQEGAWRGDLGRNLVG